jgi:hypothetical protein
MVTELESKPVLFVHLPKTGGTCLWTHLKLDENRYLCHEFLKFKTDLGDYYKITILRDPVQRIVSLYFYQRNMLAHLKSAGTLSTFQGGNWHQLYQLYREYGISDICSFVGKFEVLFRKEILPEHEKLELLSKSENMAHYFKVGFFPQSWFICDDENRLLVDKIILNNRLNHDAKKMFGVEITDKVNTHPKTDSNYLKHLKQSDIEMFRKIYESDANIYRGEKSPLTIDLFVPIYFSNSQDLRYFVTKKMFMYLRKVRDILGSESISLSFTIVGSNGDLSFDLFRDQLNGEEDVYLEFTQTYRPSLYAYSKDQNFRKMLTQKFRGGWEASIKKGKDISMLLGSNDFVCLDFFRQVAQNFDSGKKQMYGLSKSGKNIQNYCLFYQLSPERKSLTSSTLACVWDMSYPDRARKVALGYGGGCIGFNKKLYSQNRLRSTILENPWNEVTMEIKMPKEVEKTVSRDVFYLNVKTDNDMTPIAKIFRTHAGLQQIKNRDLLPKISELLNHLNKLT